MQCNHHGLTRLITEVPSNFHFRNGYQMITKCADEKRTRNKQKRDIAIEINSEIKLNIINLAQI